METSNQEWPRNPVLYEINTWVWLDELAAKYGRRVTLSNVPDEEWDGLAAYGFDAVWLMGVWQRSPAGTEIANRNQGLQDDFRRSLPDFAPQDNVGSPYCIRDYVVDRHLGGRRGLAVARVALAARGMRLLLDFVPNHVAFDHAWTTGHPEYFVHGTPDDLRLDTASFGQAGGQVIALGRDPYFPAWPDVLQLNAFAPALREAVIQTLHDVAEQCDGVRCDMAMLALSDVFARTWGARAGQSPVSEYWAEVIAAVKRDHSQFLFIAEAYWDREWDLQKLGFDYCYDKRLYDRLAHDNPESVRGHLHADLPYQQRLVRFIENHDEPRAAAAFPGARQRAAAVTMATTPGAKLFHEGQFEGRTVHVPVFLARRPQEEADQALQAFYKVLLTAATSNTAHTGEWRLCECAGWPDNQSCQNLAAWCSRTDSERQLVVVNLSDQAAQALVRVPWDDLRGRTAQLTDLIARKTFDRSGDDMAGGGLYVALDPWAVHVFECHLA